MSANDNLFVDNAGLVLLSPWLPTLFKRLELLTPIDGDERIVGAEAAGKAVNLLQFLVDGRLDRLEPALILNKLLCGLPASTPVSPLVEPAQADLDVCEDLLRSTIANWPQLRDGTSISGLRETFLQREGRLSRTEDGWRLRVERKTLDILVDQVPWSFSAILHPWMVQPVHVTW